MVPVVVTLCFSGGVAWVAASTYVFGGGSGVAVTVGGSSLPLPLLFRGGAAGSVSVDASAVGAGVSSVSVVASLVAGPSLDNPNHNLDAKS